MEKITSDNNPRIKNVIKLREKSRERKKQDLFLIDGEREIKEAIRGGFKIKELYICPDIKQSIGDFELEAVEVSREIFEKMCYKEKPDGCLAVAFSMKKKLPGLILSENPLILVLEAVEKPGNLGAIIRSAYAAGVDVVIINDEQTDIYNPNVIRASQGLVFNLPVISANFEETGKFLRDNGIQIISTALSGNTKYTDIDFQKPSAIILGTEADGLGDKWLKKSDHIVRIPMKKKMDSLNVSVSAAIMVFEAWRQRGFN